MKAVDQGQNHMLVRRDVGRGRRVPRNATRSSPDSAATHALPRQMLASANVLGPAMLWRGRGVRVGKKKGRRGVNRGPRGIKAFNAQGSTEDAGERYNRPDLFEMGEERHFRTG